MSRNSTNIFYLGIFLCAVCAIAAALMGGAAVLTKEPIQLAKSKNISDGLKVVLPPFDNQPLTTVKNIDGTLFYTATKDKKVIGYAAEVTVNTGYAGLMHALISLNPNGTIRTFIVTGHSETPGLGAEVCNRVELKTLRSLFEKKNVKHSLHKNEILDQYTGHSAFKQDSWKQPWKLKKDGGDAEYMTGATISSRAVNALAWKAASLFAKHQKELSGSKGVEK